jgi:N-acetylglucosamine-6-phosphate deacetylase
MSETGRGAALAITGGLLVDPDSGGAQAGDLLVLDGRVASIAPPGQLVIPDAVEPGDRLDASGLLVSAGLIDLQVNGAAGVDLTAEPERLWQVAAALPRHGVTSFAPTLVTTDPDTRARALATLAAGRPDDVPAGARPLGLHFEGPMLSPERNGAHDPALLREPSPDLVRGWSAEAGVLMTTIAPELPGALEVIRLLTGRGVLVSMGHTAATVAQIDAGAQAGARALTHLYNAMPGLGHREPGPVGAALSGGDLVAGVIVDGLHVHPRTVAATLRALGRRRFLAVSDTTCALDQPDGESWLGGLKVVIGGGAVRLAEGPEGVRGGLAGSAVGLDRCLRLLAEFTGRRPAEVLAAGTTVPAELIGRPELGRPQPGSPADLVLLSPGLDPVVTLVGGRILYDRHFASTQEWTEV